MEKIGMRVGAIQSADDTTVQFFGYGVYQGDRPCPLLEGMENPLIVLDDGRGEVWGCECWWGPEEKIQAFIADNSRSRTIVMVDPIHEGAEPEADGANL